MAISTSSSFLLLPAISYIPSRDCSLTLKNLTNSSDEQSTNHHFKHFILWVVLCNLSKDYEMVSVD